MSFSPPQPYIACTVTLTSANTLYNLLDLIKALGGIYAFCPAACRELTIQAQSGNNGSVFIGDANLTLTFCGFELLPGSSYSDRSHIQDVLSGQLYVRATNASTKLNVQVKSC